MKKIFFYTVMSILFVLVTFFGLGPVLFADGTTVERAVTLAVVVIIYIILAIIIAFYKKRSSR